MKTVETYDLTGMGGGYENACQKMLWTGVKYMEEKRNTKILDGRKESNNIYGIVHLPQTFDECRKEMLKAVDNDCTGVMMRCVTGHLHYIAKNGLEKWQSEMKPHRDRTVKFDLNDMNLTEDIPRD